MCEYGIMQQADNIVWDIIDCYFKENPQCLVRHHVDSYNDFYREDIFRIFNEMNPIKIVSKFDEKTKQYQSQCNLYLGGKSGKRVYFSKPVIYDGDQDVHYMFPNEARLRNMTYAMTIHYDVEVEILNSEPAPMMGGAVDDDEVPNYKDAFLAGLEQEPGKEHVHDTDKHVKANHAGGAGKTVNEQRQLNEGQQLKQEFVLEKILLGRFPIMVQSDFCILSGMPKEMRFNMGECKNDLGGYFIIDGKEKVIIPQEKFGDNMLRVNKGSSEDILFSAEIKSVSENTSKPIRSLRVDMIAPTSRYSNMNITVSIPNVRKPVPLFIVFRALGIISDKDIIETCLLDLDKHEDLMDAFIPSVHDAGPILNQLNALQYIAQLAKTKTVSNALLILSDYFLPHIGETNFREKAYYLGYMVKRLLLVANGLETPVDRDSFRFKRLELTGNMIYQLFREYYKIQSKEIYVAFETILYNDRTNYEDHLDNLIYQNYQTVFKKRTVEEGFRKAYKGNWGSAEHTKRIGAVQDLNRLSFNSALSHLRKTNLTVDAGAKLVGPRVLNGSQWGLIDPIDTPDGGNIGLHKQLSLMTYVTRHVSREPMIEWLHKNASLVKHANCSHHMLATMTKVMVNGYWAGSVKDPIVCVNKFKLYRRNGLIPLYCSICFDIKQNAISIFTDGGRLCRPIYYYDSITESMSYEPIMDTLRERKYNWINLVGGFNKRQINELNYGKFYKLSDMYEVDANAEDPVQIKRFKEKKALLDYLDPNEEETSLIAFKHEDTKSKQYTHCEIHESLIFGMMCNLVIYPHHNPATRSSFSCGQSKQAVSMYHTNFNSRMDKTAVILNQGQKPLVKSRYYEYICNEENSYGENAIVAIMCYTGYNVEDAVLVNEGALKRGLFRTTYFSVYEAHEEKNIKGDVVSEKKFLNIEKSAQRVTGLQMGFDYSKIDDYGLVKEGTELNDSTILIGIASGTGDNLVDESKTPKKGQLGIVHKTFITEGEEGTRIAKVKVREERIPAIGDKMASRSGQKGTIGMIIPEQDMPFTKDGIRPDIIINPHAIPTRMTIGQLVECIVGKACLVNGYSGDCTAFNSNGNHIGEFARVLTDNGMHSSGTEILYNGMTGEQVVSEIFMGPTYYMRLKHMVKDKVNYRAQGPRTQLTRQPVAGRANDGGLRIGEMERDSIISHGATEFLKESMLVRGDEYYMAVCNKTGAVAIYNPEKNLMMSPMADGPIKFNDSLDGKDMNVEHITKYGRSFSVVRVPYVFKLFMQELQAINVKMAIITEDNVDQFDNMNFSNNISLLTGLKLEDVVNKVSQEVDELNNLKPKKSYYEELSMSADQRPQPASPEYQPASPEYQPASPEYQPVLPDEIYKPMFDELVFEPAPAPVPAPAPASAVQEPLKKGDYVNMEGNTHVWRIAYIDNKDTLLRRRENNKNVELIVPINKLTRTAEPMQGGGIPLLNVGDKVMFRGDFDKNRKWTIDSFEKGFAVIKTDDLNGLTGGSKVVGMNDIDTFMEPETQTMIGGNAQAQSQPPIVLNIVNGDNNKVEQDSSTPGQTQTPATAQTIDEMPREEAIFDKPMIKKPAQEGGSNVFAQGALVVKKV